MGSEGVVLPVSAVGQTLGLSRRGEQLGVEYASLNRLLNDSAKSFCHGEPGSMDTLAVPLP